MTDPIAFQTVASKFGMDADQLAIALIEVKRERDVFEKLQSWTRTKKEWSKIANRMIGNADQLVKDLLYIYACANVGDYPQLRGINEELFKSLRGTALLNQLEWLIDVVQLTDFSPHLSHKKRIADNLVKRLEAVFIGLTSASGEIEMTTPQKDFPTPPAGQPTLSYYPAVEGTEKFRGPFIEFMSEVLPFFGISAEKTQAYAQRYKRIRAERKENRENFFKEITPKPES